MTILSAHRHTHTGLITDTTFSPFTTVILPYHYMATPDQKIEWNVYTFDEGLASRVPYESAARTLTQRKQTFSGYTVRQGMYSLYSVFVRACLRSLLTNMATMGRSRNHHVSNFANIVTCLLHEALSMHTDISRKNKKQGTQFYADGKRAGKFPESDPSGVLH